MTTIRQRWKRLSVVALLLLVISTSPYIFPAIIAEICLRRSEAMIQRRCFARSLILLQSAAGWSPGDPQIPILQARCSRYLEDWTACSRFLDRAETCGLPDSAIRRERLLCEVQRGEFPSGPDTTYSQIIRSLESDSSTEESIAVCETFVTGLLKLRDTDRVERLLDAWAADAPLDADLCHFRAKVSKLRAEEDQACEWLRKSCSLAPARPDLRMALGNMLGDNQQFGAAAESFSVCLELLNTDPDSADDPAQMQATANLQLARCFFSMGQTDAAERALQDASPLSHPGEALLLQGKILVSREAFAEAIALFRPALHMRSWDTEIRYALGTALRAANLSEEAAEHFEFITRASAEVERAGRLIEKAAVDPANADIRCEVAAILLKYADPKEAEPWINACLLLQPQHKLALQLRQQLSAELLSLL